MFRILLIGIILIGGGLYIVQTTSSATSGYDMHALEKEVRTLHSEIQKIEIDIADNSSIQSIKSRLGRLDMVALDQVQYVAVKDESIAKNN